MGRTSLYWIAQGCRVLGPALLRRFEQHRICMCGTSMQACTTLHTNTRRTALRNASPSHTTLDGLHQRCLAMAIHPAAGAVLGGGGGGGAGLLLSRGGGGGEGVLDPKLGVPKMA